MDDQLLCGAQGVDGKSSHDDPGHDGARWSTDERRHGFRAVAYSMKQGTRKIERKIERR